MSDDDVLDNSSHQTSHFAAYTHSIQHTVTFWCTTTVTRTITILTTSTSHACIIVRPHYESCPSVCPCVLYRLLTRKQEGVEKLKPVWTFHSLIFNLISQRSLRGLLKIVFLGRRPHSTYVDIEPTFTLVSSLTLCIRPKAIFTNVTSNQYKFNYSVWDCLKHFRNFCRKILSEH